MYKKDVPPVFEPEERFLSILKGNRMRPATVGAQGASVFASILVDNDGIASVIAFVKHFIPAKIDIKNMGIIDFFVILSVAIIYLNQLLG